MVARRYEGRQLITIPYDPVGGQAWVQGADIRLARKFAKIHTPGDMAMVCQWSRTSQVYYERLGRHKVPTRFVQKMIVACNVPSKRRSRNEGAISPPVAAI